MFKRLSVYRCSKDKIVKEDRPAKKKICPICGTQMVEVKKGIIQK